MTVHHTQQDARSELKGKCSFEIMHDCDNVNKDNARQQSECKACIDAQMTETKLMITQGAATGQLLCVIQTEHQQKTCMANH